MCRAVCDVPVLPQTTEIARLRSDVVESATARTRREQGFSRMQLQLDQALSDRNNAVAEVNSLRERLQVCACARERERGLWVCLPDWCPCAYACVWGVWLVGVSRWLPW